MHWYKSPLTKDIVRTAQPEGADSDASAEGQQDNNMTPSAGEVPKDLLKLLSATDDNNKARVQKGLPFCLLSWMPTARARPQRVCQVVLVYMLQ